MDSRWSRSVANIRFVLWKARTYHTQRYISLVVILAIIFGAVFFSNTTGLFKPKTARAALGATYTAGTLNIGGGGKYMLMQDAGCGNAALWPLDLASANAITVNNAAYQGRICIAVTDIVWVDAAGSILSIVGDVTLGQLVVTNSAQVVTAPSDANGKAAPYSSRPNWFATRFTGFLLIPANTNITIWSSGFDDGTVIENGNAVQVPGVPVSVDAVAYSVATYENNAGGGWCSNYHVTFVGPECPGGLLPAVKGVRKTFSNATAVANYVPIRISAWDVASDAAARIGYKVGAGADQTLPITALYGPCETDSALCPVGSADLTNGQGKMRFEHATLAAGVGPPPAPVVRLDLANAGEYGFFSRVDLSSAGTFSNFGKQANPGGTNNNNFDFFWGSPDFQTAGSPLSNAQRDDGLGYRIGAQPQNLGSGQPALLQNVKLQDHNDGLAIGGAINAGMRLTVTGNLTINTQAGINVANAGLPGGIQFYPGFSDRGLSGIGGQGRLAGSPGVWDWVTTGGGNSYASHWNIHGGGGGGGGKSISPGPGGGGGGAMGYGAAGFATNSSGTVMSINAAHSDSATDKVKAYGAGGAGLRGVGGGSNGDITNYYSNPGANVHDRNDGSANRGSYTAGTVTGMGGGGGQGAQGEDKDYTVDPAGSGGGSVVLVVNGNLTMTNGFINASGESPGAFGEGAGGGGTIDITVKGATFDLDANSHLYASGGSTSHDPVQNGGDVTWGYPQGGPGGGGLIKVRAASFGPAAGSGWPTDYCNGIGQPFTGQLGPSQNLQARAGSTELSNGATPAENGLIDIAYYVAGNVAGSPFCGSATVTSSQDVQISKRIQQWTGTGALGGTSPLTTYAASVGADTYWSDSVTTVPSTYLRVMITVRNPDPANPRTVNVSDVLPTGVPVAPANGTNVCVRTRSAAPTTTVCSALTTNTGTTLSKNGVVVLANAAVDVLYVAQVNSPF